MFFRSFSEVFIRFIQELNQEQLEPKSLNATRFETMKFSQLYNALLSGNFRQNNSKLWPCLHGGRVTLLEGLPF